LSQRLAAARAAGLRAEAMRVQQRRDRLGAVAARAQQAYATVLHRRRDRLSALEQLLASYSYQSVLARGFALVKRDDGSLVKRAAGIAPAELLHLAFLDGETRVVVAGEGAPPTPGSAPRSASRAPPKAARVAARPATQASLFDAEP
jgi:exodeoxyribonuclease VII large subunit